MFSRVVFEETLLALPVLGFFLFLGAFAWFTLRALRMPRSTVERMAALPLEPERPSAHERHPPSPAR
jgi:hypothetical protein